MSSEKSAINMLIEGILAGEKGALARGISIVENNRQEKEELVSLLYGKLGKAHRIGITGPPGVGKSTLTLQLAKACRAQNKSIGIVAVDPTSPFTGGALLGDRIRMYELFNDPEVFIRSMATRGSIGGLAAAAAEAGDLLDASGKSVIFFETVGTGQSELDVAEACDTVLLMLAPESGDSVQTLKAGFMEIADLIVINKADRDGADKTEIEIKTTLSLREPQEWEIPVIKTIATQNEGTDEVVRHIEKHYTYLKHNHTLEKRRREKLVRRVKSIVRSLLHDAFWTEEKLSNLKKIGESESVSNRSPYTIARDLVRKFLQE